MKSMLINKIMLCCFVVLISTWGNASIKEYLNDEEAFKFTYKVNKLNGEVELEWVIADDYFLYESEFSIKLNGIKLDPSFLKFDHKIENSNDSYLEGNKVYRSRISARFSFDTKNIHSMIVGYQGGSVENFRGEQKIGLAFMPQEKLIYQNKNVKNDEKNTYFLNLQKNVDESIKVYKKESYIEGYIEFEFVINEMFYVPNNGFGFLIQGIPVNPKLYNVKVEDENIVKPANGGIGYKNNFLVQVPFEGEKPVEIRYGFIGCVFYAECTGEYRIEGKINYFPEGTENKRVEKNKTYINEDDKREGIRKEIVVDFYDINVEEIIANKIVFMEVFASWDITAMVNKNKLITSDILEKLKAKGIVFVEADNSSFNELLGVFLMKYNISKKESSLYLVFVPGENVKVLNFEEKDYELLLGVIENI